MIARRTPHLPFRWLADRRDGTLSAPRTAEADEHLATGCRLCAARSETVRRLVAAVAAGPLDRAPAAVDRRVVALYDTHRAPRADDVLVGALVADIGHGVAPDLALSLRAAPDGPRRLLWRAGVYEIDAMVVPREGRADLLGQVVADSGRPVAGIVRASRGPRTLAASALAADGRFTFRGLAAGPVVLEGTLDGRAFVLPLLALDA